MPEPVDVTRHRALGTVAGALTAVYVVGYALDLIVLGLDPALFNRVHRFLGGFGTRVLVAVVGVAVLFHAVDGLGRAATDLWPALARHRVGLAALGRFVTLAVGLPAATAVVWPAVRAWWLR
jgi:succinate dehydrogenase/fumarate reductase cytochrome b subunit